MDQEAVNELISQSCPDWLSEQLRSEQLRHENNYKRKKTNIGAKRMNNLQKLSLQAQLTEEIDKGINHKEYAISLHLPFYKNGNITFSAWPRDCTHYESMSFELTDGRIGIKSVGKYNEEIAQIVCKHLNEWLNKE